MIAANRRKYTFFELQILAEKNKRNRKFGQVEFSEQCMNDYSPPTMRNVLRMVDRARQVASDREIHKFLIETIEKLRGEQ